MKTVVRSLAAGALLMYFFDPDRGRRRRAVIRDKTIKTWHDFTTQCDKAARDVSNRAQGFGAGVKALFHRPDGSVLAERIRSKIGRAVSHPHAITVTANDGLVELSGAILDSEVDRLLWAVRSMRGVRDIRNRLQVHQESENISSLQGGRRQESRPEFTQQNWTPALRLTAGGLGGALVLSGMRHDGIGGLARSVAGTALLTRAISNRELRKIVGVDCGSDLIHFEKALHVAAPVEEVYSFWLDYANFPRFMTHLKEVRDLGNGKSEWVAEGPGGIPVSWTAEITQQVSNRLLAWRSLPDSQVETEGVVRFDKDSNGGTRIGIRLSYSPPGGVVGHLVASLFGANPKREMDDDMVRLKSLLEIGKTRAHGVRVTRSELPHAAPAVQ